MKLTIRYTAGDPPRECEDVHDFKYPLTFLEIDVPKMEIRATVDQATAASMQMIKFAGAGISTKDAASTLDRYTYLAKLMPNANINDIVKQMKAEGYFPPKPRPTLWQRIKRYIPFLCLAIVLTGCLDYIPPPEAITGEPNYYACGYYQPPLADTAGYTVQDSTRACPDGSMPQLFEATWLDTDYDCPVIWGYVVDGSIRRRFACYSGKVDTAWPLTHKL